MDRPPFIKHFSEIQEKDETHYPGSNELLSIGSPFGKTFGLQRLGIHHEVLPPGRRTSWPHAESTEEEFVYVIEGTPDAWVDGYLHRLRPGDAVGFRPGTGISHTFLNDTETDVRLLVVGDTNREDDKIYYPLNPERKAQIGGRWWHDVPNQQLGPHNGLPKKPKNTRASVRLAIDSETELTLLSREHAIEFLALIDSSRSYLREWMAWVDSTRSVSDLTRFIDSTLEDFAQRRSIAMWIWHKKQIVGIIHLRELSWENKKAMIGYWVGEAFRGKGFAKKAARAICDFAFNELKLNRIEIRCAVGNVASQAIPLALGFKREGVLEMNEWLHDHFVDHIVFGLLAKDWRGKRPHAPRG